MRQMLRRSVRSGRELKGRAATDARHHSLERSVDSIEERDQVPRRLLFGIEERRNQQPVGVAHVPQETGSRACQVSIGKAARRVLDSQSAEGASVGQIEDALQLDFELEHLPWRIGIDQIGIPVTRQVAREVGTQVIEIAGERQRRFSGAIPAILTRPVGKTRIEWAVWRANRKVAVNDALPRT